MFDAYTSLSSWGDVPHYERARLHAGMRITGPAIIEQMDATTLILPRQLATVDSYGNLLLREEETA